MFALVPIARRIRTSLASLLILAAGSFAAHAQTANTNSYYADIAWTPTYVSGQQILAPVPNAQITVCAYPASAVPCTNLATLYYGPTVGGGINPTNPTPTDQYGNFSFWAAPGYYQYTVTNSFGQSAGPYTVVLGGSGGGGGGSTIPVTTLVLKGSNSPNVASAATPGTDYVIPSGSILGTAANLSGTPILPNGTSATTQTPGDATTKLSTDAFVAAAITASASTSIPATTSLLAGSGTAGVASAVTAIPNGTTATTQSVADNTTKVATDAFVLANASAGSQQVVYASKIPGVTPGVAVIPGSSATSTTDSATPINEAIAGGNVDLEVDSGFALSTSLVVSSNTTIHCIAPQYGFIMQAASNASVIVNAHQNAPTTSSGTGGYLPSNITDQNIKILGCQLNANSTQAATGTNSRGTAHGATPGGLFTYGVFFAGVNGLTIEGNEIYDSACWNTFLTNTLYARVANNYIHQPSPLVQYKFTDGVHLIGPDEFTWIQNNRVNAGDDSIALNADDGNRTGSGDPNAGYVQTFVKWGPITDAHIDNNTLDGTYFGLRLYSATELIDRIEVSNLNGTACGNTGTIAALTALGNGNIGKVNINGWNLQTSGSCNLYSFPYNFLLDANFQNIEIDNVSMSNPAVTWPVLTQIGGAGGILSLRNWNLLTSSSTFSDIISLTGGSVGNIAASGISWSDSIGTGNVFSGSQVPGTLTCSNYAGPNLLLAGGFAPVNENGDCFTNTYTAVTTYVNTTFNEQTYGTLLAGTAPATCSNGCTGDWTASAGGPSSGQWAYSTNSASLSGICTSGGSDIYCPVYINAGVANYTMRVNVSQWDSDPIIALGFVMRWTNNSNFVTFVQSVNGTWGLYDVVSGTTTAITSCSLGTSLGVWTVIMNGTTAKLTNPSGTTCTGTISGSNTSDNVGLNSNAAIAPGVPDIITSFSVKSN